MGNEIVETKNMSVRKKLYKKAAVLAAIATITGVASTSHQKAEKSEALFGAIFTIATTLISVGTGIAGTVQNSIAKSEQERAEREEQERAEREERERLAREAEEQRIAEALKNPENDVRLQESMKQESQQAVPNKIINMGIADNSVLAEEIQQQSNVSRGGMLNRPVSPPKDIQIGGFGAEDEDEEEELTVQEIDESIDAEDMEDIDEDMEDIDEEEVESSNYSLLNHSDDIDEDDLDEKNESNIVKFSLNDLKIGDEESDEQFSELISQTESEDVYAELDISALMSQEDAMNHELVQGGLLSAEDVILLDFGIRNGSINAEVINGMYEQGLITDSYYEGAYSLMESIYGENSEAEDVYDDVEESDEVYEDVEEDVIEDEEGFGI